MSQTPTAQTVNPQAPPPPAPWERQPGETAKAHAALVEYLKLGVRRTVRQVARLTDRHLSVIGVWSSRYHWVERASAWDAEQARVQLQTELSEAARLSKKWSEDASAVRAEELKIGQMLLDKARMMLDWPLARRTVQEDGHTVIVEPANWTVKDAREYLELATTLIRRNDKLPRLLTMNERLAMLSELGVNPLVPPGDRIRAIEAYSRISGDQAPEVQEVRVANESPAAPLIRRLTVAERLAEMRAARQLRLNPPAAPDQTVVPVEATPVTEQPPVPDEPNPSP